MPASTQFRTPSAERVWATICRSSRSASTTAARSVATGYWTVRGFAVGVNIPPVAIILMQSAPSFFWRRTATTTSSWVSASVPNMWQWPAVVVMGVPASRRRGPGTTPARMASRSGNTTSFRLPMSRRVVTPDSRAARAFAAARSTRRSGDSEVTRR